MSDFLFKPKTLSAYGGHSDHVRGLVKDNALPDYQFDDLVLFKKEGRYDRLVQIPCQLNGIVKMEIKHGLSNKSLTELFTLLLRHIETNYSSIFEFTSVSREY